MKKLLIFLATMFVLLVASPDFAQKVRKETFDSQGKKRTYYLVVPDQAKVDHPAPLLILLHGSGHNGLSLVDKWKDLATKEGVMIAGPDSNNPESWKTPVDGPDFLRDLVTELLSKYPIDQHRLYLFGHSGGAVFALYMALFESEYFAAVAIHAGALNPKDVSLVERTKRKIPIYIAVGTVDPFFPLADVRGTRDLLNKNGFNAQLTEIKGHDHGYYDLAPKINADVWNFLKEQRLAGDPLYTQYSC